MLNTLFMYYQTPLLFILLLQVYFNYRRIDVELYAYVAFVINIINILGYYEF